MPRGYIVHCCMMSILSQASHLLRVDMLNVEGVNACEYDGSVLCVRESQRSESSILSKHHSKDVIGEKRLVAISRAKSIEIHILSQKSTPHIPYEGQGAEVGEFEVVYKIVSRPSKHRERVLSLLCWQ